VERPRIMAKTIAETLNLTVRTASRHVRFLVNMDLIKYCPYWISRGLGLP